jgi:HD-like signal output (HDOD) protein
MAFDALDAFPALSESRNRVLAATAKDAASTDIVSAVESDVSLVLAVLRLANAGRRTSERVDTVMGAVELLRPEAVQALASRVQTFDFFERPGLWGSAPEHFRLHALATQRVADRIASEVIYQKRDSLAVTSLLHDIGKLVLIQAYPDYPSQVHDGAQTPEDRIHAERIQLGVDHALVGSVLVRRWGLPGSLATPIEHHHDPEAEGEAAIVRLADMLAHYEHGASVSPGEMLQSARAAGLATEQLRGLLYGLASAKQRPRRLEKCPLSQQELRVLQRLAQGRVYKEIAHELALSVSTIRTHLHNAYRKLGVPGGAQAVILANRRGWL